MYYEPVLLKGLYFINLILKLVNIYTHSLHFGTAIDISHFFPLVTHVLHLELQR